MLRGPVDGGGGGGGGGRGGWEGGCRLITQHRSQQLTCSGAYLAADQCSCPTLICSSPVRLKLPLQAATMLPGVMRQG
jgi:hypothetical protein